MLKWPPVLALWSWNLQLFSLDSYLSVSWSVPGWYWWVFGPSYPLLSLRDWLAFHSSGPQKEVEIWPPVAAEMASDGDWLHTLPPPGYNLCLIPKKQPSDSFGWCAVAHFVYSFITAITSEMRQFTAPLPHLMRRPPSCPGCSHPSPTLPPLLPGCYTTLTFQLSRLNNIA